MIPFLSAAPAFRLYKGGQSLMGAMAPYFISASYHDEAGAKNDTLEVTLADRARELPLPREDDLLIAYGGATADRVAMLGAFRVNSFRLGWSGGPETMTMTARAATMTGAVKAGGAKHWDDKTLGDILGDTAKAAGLKLAIPPELAQVKVPYALRWEASPVDFALRLAAEHGAIVKPAGERLAVVQKGSGKGASGTALPLIRVTRRGCSGWEIQSEPRPRHGKVHATYHDRKTGRRKTATESTGGEGPQHTLIHPRGSEDEAKAAAKARARELNMATGSGHFVVPFDPSNVAGAMVDASGFGAGIDGQWCCESIDTTWAGGQPVMSTINVTAKPDGRKQGSK